MGFFEKLFSSPAKKEVPKDDGEIDHAPRLKRGYDDRFFTSTDPTRGIRKAELFAKRKAELQRQAELREKSLSFKLKSSILKFATDQQDKVLGLFDADGWIASNIPAFNDPQTEAKLKKAQNIQQRARQAKEKLARVIWAE